MDVWGFLTAFRPSCLRSSSGSPTKTLGQVNFKLQEQLTARRPSATCTVPSQHHHLTISAHVLATLSTCSIDQEMLFSRIPLLLALIHSSVLASQPSAPSPISAPLRELPWSQLNFLHTTDTHGWHGGHLQEAQYSADWGDYISFADHLRTRADNDGSDLLVIDTGDRVEGNGLYDASNPKGK